MTKNKYFWLAIGALVVTLIGGGITFFIDYGAVAKEVESIVEIKQRLRSVEQAPQQIKQLRIDMKDFKREIKQEFKDQTNRIIDLLTR